MLFNSATYALFLPIVLALYFLLRRSLGLQNLLLLVASYFFYGWWDWRFLGLLAFSTTNDYLLGLALEASKKPPVRRALLIVSLVVNLGILGFFKYYNFFVSSFIDAFAGIGVVMHAPTLNVVLPVGISFYTFQSMTYAISIYRREFKPTHDPIAFYAYVAFFPQLVAGPIERANHLLPQFLRPRPVVANDFSVGIRRILWGLFCKIVVADNCAVVANALFNSEPSTLSGSAVLIGAFFFAFQIYGDFAGYSHIAIGSARLMGFDLMQNFSTPYFSRSIPEFWQRWHISLSTWFRDYVYIPLGGNRHGKRSQIVNTLATFTISGLWHGANWTFVAWGFLNGLLCIPRVLIGQPIVKLTRSPNVLVRTGSTVFCILATFMLILVTWIFFRAQSIGAAAHYFGALFSLSTFDSPLATLQTWKISSSAFYAGVAVCALVLLEWFQQHKTFALELDDQVMAKRWATYAGVMALLLSLRYTGQPLDFIYFQF